MSHSTYIAIAHLPVNYTGKMRLLSIRASAPKLHPRNPLGMKVGVALINALLRNIWGLYRDIGIMEKKMETTI